MPVTSLRVMATAAASAALAAGHAVAAQSDRDSEIRGWLEHAIVEPVDLKVDAKLDPGAKTSSIHAEILRGPQVVEDEVELDDAEVEIEESEDEDDAERTMSVAVEVPDADTGNALLREGKRKTVVFRLTNEDGESRTLEREIVRYVSIKNKTGGVVDRPVVRMGFCVAGVEVEGEVNLADRSDFNYPLLVGRNMLSEAAILVDSREIYTRRARCPKPDGGAASAR